MAEVDGNDAGVARTESVAAALRAAVDDFGPALFQDRDALRADLEARCPHGTADIALLLAGLDEQVPQALLGVGGEDEALLLATRLERRLSQRLALNNYAAAWVVETWRIALGRFDAAMPRPHDASSDIADEAPLATGDAAAAEPSAGPAWLNAAPPTSFRRWAGISTGILMAAVAVALVVYDGYDTARPPVVGEPARVAERARVADTPRVAAPAPAAPAVAAPAVVAPAVPNPAPVADSSPPEIVDVASDDPLVADGRQRPLFVALKNARSDVESVESRFVGGDDALRSAAAVVVVSKGAIRDARVPAGMIGLHSTRPLSATFEYVVTTAKGGRSAPFAKELRVAPVAATPPAITIATVSDGVAPGQPFTVTVGVRPGGRPIASIERTIVDTRPGAKADVRIIRVETLRGTADGPFTIPMRAARAGGPTAIDLVAIDADGLRSAPRRVEIGPASPSRAAAPACADCGTVVAVQPISANPTLAERLAEAFGSGPPRRDRGRYDVVVRTDDRATRTFRRSTPLKPGARVRVVRGTLVPVDASAPAGR